MRKVFKKAMLGFLSLSIVLTLTACGGGAKENEGLGNGNDQKAFLIGVIPVQNKGNMQAAMDKLEEKLTEGIGRNVDIKIYSDYNAVVEAMKYNKMDMAYYGPLTYVIANNEFGAKAIITQTIHGQPFYYSYMIVPSTSKLNSIDDLVKNAGSIRFAFGDINSTSGSLIPSIELKKQGVYTDQNNHKFKQVTYTGSHDITALAIQNNQYDAGAIDSAIFEQLVADKKVDGSKIKKIWQSEKLFQYPWAVTKSTDEATIKKLQDTFTQIKDEDILGVFGADGFITASDKDYESIRKAAKEAGRIK